MSEKLTIQDPISTDILDKFQELASARAQFCEKYVDLDDEKLRLQLLVRKIDAERQKLFEKVLTDRGIDPTDSVEIDGKTGQISRMTPLAPPV